MSLFKLSVAIYFSLFRCFSSPTGLEATSFLETALPVLSPTAAPISHGEAQWRMLLISPLLLYIYIWGMWTWIGIFSLWRDTGSSNVEEAAFSQVLVQCALGHFRLREQAHSQGQV